MYRTAFAEATKRVEEKNDVKAMTLLAELYADGLGVRKDEQKAADWYRHRRRARRPRSDVRAGDVQDERPRRPARPRRRRRSCSPRRPSSATPPPPTISPCSIVEGQLFPQDFKRAAELLRIAAQAGNPEAQYALATFYKEGRGVPQDLREAARLLGAAALADNTDAEVEYGIALFNGTGVAKNEAAAATYLTKAARRGSPIAQNRLAFMYATGQGVKRDPVQAARWHLIARAGGANDLFLEDFCAR